MDYQAINRLKVRNAKRNAHLYSLPESEENISYIVCPVLGIRTLNIKKQYIENILEMSVEEFKRRFPNQLTSCAGLQKVISKGVSTVGDDGLTPSQRAQIKARETLTKVGEDGLTGDERRGIKTRASHLANIDENGLNGYQKLAIDARPKQKATMIADGRVVERDVDIGWETYRNFATWWAEQYEAVVAEGHMLGKNGVEGAHQIDHIYSVHDGFVNKVSPFVVSHINNLRRVTWLENIQKHRNSEITLDELLNRCDETLENSEKEFNAFMEVCNSMPNGTILSANILIELNKRKDMNARVFRKLKI